jgi:8-oxo-dGTP pyrophosphatase MutT (NUDIX family)
MVNFNSIIKETEKRLKLPLPGTSAHLKMASDIRLSELTEGYDIPNADKSSVLILLYPHRDSICFVLIKRQNNNSVHSGQISFPGGRMEGTDSSYIETAMREANEEVGINLNEVTIIGSLTELYIPPSNFLVFPVISYMKTRPELTPNKNEVAEIIEADLLALINTDSVNWKEIEVRGVRLKTPYYSIDGHTVWGATAMILSELIAIMKPE